MEILTKKVPKYIPWIMAAIALFGFVDATYLTYSHFTKSPLSCKILEGCNEVTNSEYSEIFGIPLALLGSLYYLAVLFGTLLYIDTKRRFFLIMILPLTAFGFLFSLYLLYLMFFVINAVCIYCLGSALTSTLLFLISIYIFFRYKKFLFVK